MSKVVLIQPPMEDFYLTKKRTLPYGLASVAAGIREKGFEVEILDALATGKSKPIAWPDEFSYLTPFYGEKDLSFFSLFHEFRHFGYSYEHIGTKIKEKQPFVVGISSLFTAYCNEAVKTARAVKKFYPQCQIVLGGHHPTLFPEKVLAVPEIDFVLRGEGEKTMPLLCQALKTGTDLEQIPGIAFRKGKTHFCAPPAWMDDFKSLPIPAMDLVNHEFYQRHNTGATIVVSSRGCPMRCSYCSVSAASAHAPFRQRAVADVIKELETQAKDHDIGFIDFEDENLCLNKPWFLHLFKEINQVFSGRKIELRAMNGLYPPAIDEEIVSVMKDSGFKTLNLSLGSTSKPQLKKFNRRDVRAAFENALSLARKYNLECVSYIIAAAPGQTADSSLDDLLYLAEKRTLVGLSVYYPAPGSLDYQVCRDKNILPEHFSLMRSTALPLDHTTSRLEAVTLLRLSRLLNFMKHLVDTKGALPEPKPFSSREIFVSSDRGALSEKLLSWFLHDGNIRGVRPDGGIYAHLADHGLARQFIKRINSPALAGVRTF